MPGTTKRSGRRRFVSRRRSSQRSDSSSMALSKRLSELIDVQRTQQTYQIPRIPDTRPKFLSRHHVVSVQRTFQTVLNFTPDSPGQVLQHSLLDLPDAAAFCAIFDRYRIDQVQVSYGLPNTISTVITAIDPCPSLETLQGTFVASDLLEYDTVQYVTNNAAGYIQRTYAPAYQLLPFPTNTNDLSMVSPVGVQRGYVSADLNGQSTKWNSLLFYVPGAVANTGITCTITYLLNFIGSK